MDKRIVRIGLAAVAVVILAFIGINLLAGRGTGAQLTPGSALAQTPGNTTPDPFVGTWRMRSPVLGGWERFVISKHDGQYTLLERVPGLTSYTRWEVSRQGDQLSADLHLMNPTKRSKLIDVRWVRLSVAKVPGQLLYRYDGTDVRTPSRATMTKVSDSTATPTPAPWLTRSRPRLKLQ